MLLQQIEKLGDNALYVVERTGLMGVFLASCLAKAVTPPYRWFPILKQVHFIGARSTIVIIVAGLFTGMVVALQFYDSLVRFGAVAMLGAAVALGLIRELAPVLTALVVIGRVGSAICAEIGIMRSDEQIDALECMAVDPYRYLIVPKLVAGLIAVPVLTLIFSVIGIAGGWFVGVVMFGVSEAAYFQGMYETVVWDDIEMGLVKSFFFGLLIVWVAAGKGYFLHLERNGSFGAEGVSHTTTDAVVISIIGVLVADYLISALML